MADNDKISQFDSPDESSGFLLWQMTNLWQRRINEGLSLLGLPHLLFVLLATLTWYKQTNKMITQVELATLAKIYVRIPPRFYESWKIKGLS